MKQKKSYTRKAGRGPVPDKSKLIAKLLRQPYIEPEPPSPLPAVEQRLRETFISREYVASMASRFSRSPLIHPSQQTPRVLPVRNYFVQGRSAGLMTRAIDSASAGIERELQQVMAIDYSTLERRILAANASFASVMRRCADITGDFQRALEQSFVRAIPGEFERVMDDPEQRAQYIRTHIDSLRALGLSEQTRRAIGAEEPTEPEKPHKDAGLPVARSRVRRTALGVSVNLVRATTGEVSVQPETKVSYDVPTIKRRKK